MSKRAEIKAKEYARDFVLSVDHEADVLEAFCDGYEQAEEDLALTWEDIKLINNILFDLYFEGWKTDSEEQSRARYQEALCRFNEKRKEE